MKTQLINWVQLITEWAVEEVFHFVTEVIFPAV